MTMVAQAAPADKESVFLRAPSSKGARASSTVLNRYYHYPGTPGDYKLAVYMRETLEKWTIVRPILMYGWNHVVTRPNPATWIYEKLMRGEEISMVTDVHENPLYNIQCGHGLWAVIAKRKPGVFHFAGRDSMDRYQFAVAVAETFGLDKSLIKPVTSKAFPSIARRPKNTTFVTRRMERELGVKPLTVREGLAAMKAAMTARG